MNKVDNLGNYLKTIERNETSRVSDHEAVYIRIDGNRFSKFTRGMNRPFDEQMSQAMVATTASLVEETGALVGYTQSDEISLILHARNPTSELWHGGKFQKLTSRSASKATHLFYRNALKFGLDKFVEHQFPEFDSRAFGVSLEDAAKCLLWREIDATKNAIQMISRHYFSHKSLYKKNTDDQINMLTNIGIDVNNYPVGFLRGVLLKKVTKLVTLTADELQAIPAVHRPAGPIQRSVVEQCALPGRTMSMADRVEYYFKGN